MTEPTTPGRITAQLSEIEADHGVTILYACESGSRGWGFASQDSDYDVRFIYRHPRDWYLSVVEQRDVIELQLSRLSVTLAGKRSRYPAPAELDEFFRWVLARA